MLRVVVWYRRFGTLFPTRLQGSSILKMLVIKHRPTPRNMLHERRPELRDAVNMKSRVSAICVSEAGDGWVVGGWEVGRYRSAGRAHGDGPHPQL
jgi:hypothetical protein